MFSWYRNHWKAASFNTIRTEQLINSSRVGPPSIIITTGSRYGVVRAPLQPEATIYHFDHPCLCFVVQPLINVTDQQKSTRTNMRGNSVRANSALTGTVAAAVRRSNQLKLNDASLSEYVVRMLLLSIRFGTKDRNRGFNRRVPLSRRGYKCVIDGGLIRGVNGQEAS